MSRNTKPVLTDGGAQKAGCGHCGCVGYRMPEEQGRYAFDHIENGATVCVEPEGDVVIHPNGGV